PEQAAGNVQADTELFRQPLVTLRPPDQRCVTAFGKTRARVAGERVGDVDVAKPHQRVRQRFVEHLAVAIASRCCWPRLLTISSRSASDRQTECRRTGAAT